MLQFSIIQQAVCTVTKQKTLCHSVYVCLILVNQIQIGRGGGGGGGGLRGGRRRGGRTVLSWNFCLSSTNNYIGWDIRGPNPYYMSTINAKFSAWWLLIGPHYLRLIRKKKRLRILDKFSCTVLLYMHKKTQLQKIRCRDREKKS